MRSRALLLGLSLVLFACTGDDITYGPDAAEDATASDAPSTSDGSADAALDAGVDAGAALDASAADAAADAPSDAALPPSACDDGGGCRTFASYCSDQVLKPCTCYALGASDPDPTCNGQQVTCLTDPCAGKTAVCGDGGTCTLN